MQRIRNWLADQSRQQKSDTMQPVLFVGHGSPMNAVLDNDFTRALSSLGNSLPRPRAVLTVSAHWLTRGSFVLSSAKPRTIHDFYGFPEELSRVDYPAPGAPEIAREVSALVSRTAVGRDESWGLDHGTWSILRHIFPRADIPVIQLSIDYTQPPDFHYALARELAPLRRQGILILGSGNIVHNLRRLDWSDMYAPPMDWAQEFDETVWQHILKADHRSLIHYQQWGALSRLAVPTNDHYLPLIYVLALQEKGEAVQSVYHGFQHGSISMRCIRIS